MKKIILVTIFLLVSFPVFLEESDPNEVTADSVNLILKMENPMDEFITLYNSGDDLVEFYPTTGFANYEELFPEDALIQNGYPIIGNEVCSPVSTDADRLHPRSYWEVDMNFDGTFWFDGLGFIAKYEEDSNPETVTLPMLSSALTTVKADFCTVCCNTGSNVQIPGTNDPALECSVIIQFEIDFSPFELTAGVDEYITSSFTDVGWACTGHWISTPALSVLAEDICNPL